MYFSYAFTALWYDRQRYLPGVLAVVFSATLVALQWGLLLGFFQFASLTVDRSQADVWVGGPNLQAADLAAPIPERYLERLASQPEVEYAEVYLQERTFWARSDGRPELCMIIGSRLEEGALGAVPELTPELRARLAERGTVVIDESDRERLGVSGVGAVGEVRGRRALVVGLVRGYSGLSGAHVFCSVETARELLLFPPDRVTYILARCRDRAAAPAVAQRLRAAYPGLSAFATEGLSRQSRWYWLTETKAGLALGYAAILGLIVGAVVTGQTLYTATAAQLREYAVLWALGVPLRRMAALVLAEAFGVGVAGVVLALPVVFLLAKGASLLNVTVLLPVWVLAATAGVTLVMALASGLAGLRLLWRLEPAALLR